MFDHAQSPRLGQRTAVENPGVQLTTQALLPEVAYRGQMVYLLDIQQLQVFDGVGWQNVTGASATGQTFVSATEPVADAVGDLWVNTTDYQLYVWDGSAWQHTSNTQDVQFQRVSIALVKALNARGAGLAHQTIFYDTSPPVAPVARDLWTNVTSNTVWDYIGGTWSEITDPAIAGPINDAGMARSILDGMIEVYTDSVEPTGLAPQDIGDLWQVSNLNNLVRGWTGAMWVDLQVTSDQLQNGAVDTPQIAVGAVDGSYQIMDHSIVRNALGDRVIGTDQIDDFAVAVTKFRSLDHHIY